jgi:hypothetical protein
MVLYGQNMLAISHEHGREDPVYEELGIKFGEQFSGSPQASTEARAGKTEWGRKKINFFMICSVFPPETLSA